LSGDGVECELLERNLPFLVTRKKEAAMKITNFEKDVIESFVLEKYSEKKLQGLNISEIEIENDDDYSIVGFSRYYKKNKHSKFDKKGICEWANPISIQVNRKIELNVTIFINDGHLDYIYFDADDGDWENNIKSIEIERYKEVNRKEGFANWIKDKVIFSKSYDEPERINFVSKEPS